MEHLILLVLCCIFVGITSRDQALGLALAGGTVIFAVLQFIHWVTPDALAVLSATFNSGARFTAHLWSALLR